MSTHSHQHPEDYSHPTAYRETTDAERDARAEYYDEILANYWRCLPCDLTFDGGTMADDGYETDIYGALKCPNCGTVFNSDERVKKF